jgi:hypothetical protein
MRKKRSNAPWPVPGPPANTEAAALLIRQYAVKLYDKQDGNGVDWRVIAEPLFRAGFDALDKITDEEKRKAVATGVHDAAYPRMAGGYAVKDDRPEPSFPGTPIDPGAVEPVGGRLSARRPRPPH